MRIKLPRLLAKSAYYAACGLVGLAVGMWFTQFRLVGMSRPSVSVERLDGHSVITVDNFDHPPWAHNHVLTVDFDYDLGTIDISEYAALPNPWSDGCMQSRWPLVIRNGLLKGVYDIRYWDGRRFVLSGTVLVHEDGIILACEGAHK